MAELRLSQRVAADHPSLPGHFPGRPIVPGVVLLDLVQTCARAQLALGRLRRLPSVKFLAPLAPEQDFEIVLVRGVGEDVAFRVEADGQVLVQGRLEFEP